MPPSSAPNDPCLLCAFRVVGNHHQVKVDSNRISRKPTTKPEQRGSCYGAIQNLSPLINSKYCLISSYSGLFSKSN